MDSSFSNTLLVQQKSVSTTDLLKQATHDIHQRLHQSPLLAKLLSPTITADDLVICLEHFFVFYSAVETLKLATTDNKLRHHKAIALYSSPHLEWLRQDLTRFGGSRSRSDDLTVNANKHNLFKPDDITDEFVWGLLYVTEGSLLGGNIIAKHLSGKFTHPVHAVGSQQTSQSISRFFYAFGKENNIRHWQKVKFAINHHFAKHSFKQNLSNKQNPSTKNLLLSAQKIFLALENIFTGIFSLEYKKINN